MKKQFKNFWVLTGLASMFSTLSLGFILQHSIDRAPSSNIGFNMEIKSMYFPLTSDLQNLNNVWLRLVFEGSQDHIIDLNKDQLVTLNPGEEISLNMNVDVQSSWIKDDTVKFRVEVIQGGSILGDNVLVRCQFASKDLSKFNRAYTCTLPLSQALTKKQSQGEEVAQVDTRPFLNYRLSSKDIENISVASH